MYDSIGAFSKQASLRREKVDGNSKTFCTFLFDQVNWLFGIYFKSSWKSLGANYLNV